MKLTDEKLLYIAQQEAISASGRNGGELAAERSAAMDYYLGNPYGDEVEGQSAVVTREVMETIEWILPSLVRVFCDADNLVTFEPVGPEDEEQAEQESDVCNYVYWKQNKGFYNTYTFLKDALLSKTGILKIWWKDDEKEEREEYQGLDPMQFEQLISDAQYDRELIELEQSEYGINATFKATKKLGRVCIEVIPPEEFGVSKDANSPYAKDAKSCFHRTKKSKSDLIKAGYSRKLVETLPTDDGETFTQEREARRHLADEQEDNSDLMRDEYWVTEVYLYADRDDDGIDELLKVTYAGSNTSDGSAKLLDVEEVDAIPFVTASPVLLTHKFYGLSIADLTMDIQRIKSTLTRQVLTNAYIANNGRTAINDDKVNIDDVLTSRPQGVVRVASGDQPVNAYIMPIPHAQLPPETFPLMEYLDRELKQRTGASEELAGLDKASLANVNTGVMAMAFDASRMKIELIARTIGEIGFVPLFKDIHQLLSKYQDREMVMRLRNKWVPVNPSEWKDREDVTVKVGVGQVSKERKIMAMDAVLQRQQMIVEGGGMGTVILPQHLYQTHKDWCKAWGLEPDLYFPDPQTIPPPPPPPPDPSIELAKTQAQAMMVDAQSKMARAQVEAQKVQAEERMQQAEIAIKMREQEMRSQVEGLKGELAMLKSGVDSEGKVASMASESMKRDMEAAIRVLEMKLQAASEDRNRELELYKANQDAALKMTELAIKESVEEQKLNAKEPSSTKAEASELAAMVMDLHKRLDEQAAPKEIMRDANGLIVAIGKSKVKRDASGKALSIG